MSLLISADSSNANAVRFLEEAITILLKTRLVLQFSYIFGFYLQGNNVKLMVFELLQVS